MKTALMTAIAVSLFAVPAWAGDGCVTQSCHPKMLDFKFVHGPVAVQDCVYCHTETGEHKFKLAAQGASLCAICHEFDPKGKQDCTTCHDPHGTQKEFHLKDKASGKCPI